MQVFKFVQVHYCPVTQSNDIGEVSSSLNSRIMYPFLLKHLESSVLYNIGFSPAPSWNGSGCTTMLHRTLFSASHVVKAMKDGRARITEKAEASFLMNGFRNLKDATAKFAKHECSNFHKTCAQALLSTVDVGGILNKQATSEKQKKLEYLMKVLSTVCFLEWQGPALHGDGDECDSNVHQLLLLRSDDFPPIREFMERKQLKFTSHEIQNELLSVMAHQELREIAASLQSANCTHISMGRWCSCCTWVSWSLPYRLYHLWGVCGCYQGHIGEIELKDSTLLWPMLQQS